LHLSKKIRCSRRRAWPTLTARSQGRRVQSLCGRMGHRKILLGAFDRIVYSSANYWVAMLSDLAAALAFLVFGLNRFFGPRVAGGVVIVGPMSRDCLRSYLH